MTDHLAGVVAELDADRLARLTMDLIDIPSPMGGEAGVAHYLRDRFVAAGLRVSLQEIEPDRYNIVGRLEGGGAGPTLLYVGHMDTTWGGDEDAVRDLGPGYRPSAVMEDDWVLGMGAYNMKSGLASMVHAVEAIAASGVELGGDLIIAGVSGETCHAQSAGYQGARYRGTGVGARFLVTNGVTADLAVISEPTASRIVSTTGGYLLFEVGVQGVPGATYRRGGGAASEVKAAPDALAGGLHIIEAIQEWARIYEERTTYHGEAATHVAVIAVESGHPWRPSKHASFSRLYVEVGLMPGASQTAVEWEFKTNVRKGALEAGLQPPSITLLQNTPGSLVEAADPVVTTLASAHERVHGRAAPVTFDAFHADTTALTRYGIPTVCYGPAGRMRGGGSGYYGAEGEMCFMPDILAGSKVFATLAVDVCERPRSEFPTTMSGPEASTVIR